MVLTSIAVLLVYPTRTRVSPFPLNQTNPAKNSVLLAAHTSRSNPTVIGTYHWCSRGFWLSLLYSIPFVTDTPAFSVRPTFVSNGCLIGLCAAPALVSPAGFRIHRPIHFGSRQNLLRTFLLISFAVESPILRCLESISWNGVYHRTA